MNAILTGLGALATLLIDTLALAALQGLPTTWGVGPDSVSAADR